MIGLSGRTLRFLAPLWLAAASAPLAAADELSPWAEAYVESAWPADGPGASVIVTRGGETIYAGARGLADVVSGRPIDVDTVFRFGSITKQFTAALVLQLVDDGKVSLDDPLRKFVPDYPEPGAGVTVRQLLNHTSGIHSFTALPGVMSEAFTSRVHTPEKITALIRNEPLDFAPGSDWRYNNSGYHLLEAVIEAVTGKPWQVVLEQRITRPLGLTTIHFGLDEDAITNRALPYSRGPDGVTPAQRSHLSWAGGSGGLVGSVRDLARWAQALHHGRVVSAASYAAMIAPTVLPSGRTVPYGFGLGAGELRGFKTISHAGGLQGALTDSIYLPEQGLFVAVFANSDSPQSQPGFVSRRLAAKAAGNPFAEYRPIFADLAALEPFFGLYAASGGPALDARFFARDERLFIQNGDSAERRVYASAGNRLFFGPDDLTWIELRREPSGAVVADLHPNGEDRAVVLTRTGPIQPAVAVPRAVLERYVGRYELNGTIATVGLTDDDRLTVGLTGQPEGPPLRTISANEFAADAVGVRITFEGEGPRTPRIRSRYAGSEVVGTRIADGDAPASPTARQEQPPGPAPVS